MRTTRTPSTFFIPGKEEKGRRGEEARKMLPEQPLPARPRGVGKEAANSFSKKHQPHFQWLQLWEKWDEGETYINGGMVHRPANQASLPFRRRRGISEVFLSPFFYLVQCVRHITQREGGGKTLFLFRNRMEIPLSLGKNRVEGVFAKRNEGNKVKGGCTHCRTYIGLHL